MVRTYDEGSFYTILIIIVVFVLLFVALYVARIIAEKSEIDSESKKNEELKKNNNQVHLVQPPINSMPDISKDIPMSTIKRQNSSQQKVKVKVLKYPTIAVLSVVDRDLYK